jgi:hypothetical protein
MNLKPLGFSNVKHPELVPDACDQILIAVRARQNLSSKCIIEVTLEKFTKWFFSRSTSSSQGNGK